MMNVPFSGGFYRGTNGEIENAVFFLRIEKRKIVKEWNHREYSVV